MDAKWLEALKLPLRISLALTFACVAAVSGDELEIFQLSEVYEHLKQVLILIIVLFGSLSVFELGSLVIKRFQRFRFAKHARARQAARKVQEDAECEERRINRVEQINRHLDTLSDWEKINIIGAIKDGSPSFYTYAHSPPVTQLQGKGLVTTPGGEHNVNHYPFSFPLDVWEELQKRRDDFLAEEAEIRKRLKL